MALLDLWKWQKEAGEGLASSVFGSATTKKEVAIQTSSQTTYAPVTTNTVTYQPAISSSYSYQGATYVIESPYATVETKKETTASAQPSVYVIPTSTTEQATEQGISQAQSDLGLGGVSSTLILLALVGVGAFYLFSRKGKK